MQIPNFTTIYSAIRGNDYKEAHNNSRNLIKTTGTPIDLRVDLEDYDRCFDLGTKWCLIV